MAALAVVGCGGQSMTGAGDGKKLEDGAATDIGGGSPLANHPQPIAGSAGTYDSPPQTGTSGNSGTGGNTGYLPGGDAGTTSYDPAPGGLGGSFEPGLSACGENKGFAVSATLSDLNGRAKVITNGKQSVTVKSVEELETGLDGPPGLKTRTYVLHGETGEWRLDATIPGLTENVIKVGDVLDLRLDTYAGYVPLVGFTNQVFGLFVANGKLLLFGADIADNELKPDLAFLGLDLADGGQICGRIAGCSTIDHRANINGGALSVQLSPGGIGMLGSLQIALPFFDTLGPHNGAGSGACDGSGMLRIVGVDASASE
jgi:hypothetical protein